MKCLHGLVLICFVVFISIHPVDLYDSFIDMFNVASLPLWLSYANKLTLKETSKIDLLYM